MMTVTDFGDSVRVQWSGRNHLNQERVGYTFIVCAPQHKGDLNLDGNFTASDVVLQVECIFTGIGNCTSCILDVNCDGNLSGSDVVSEIYRVFQGPGVGSWCGI